MIIEETMRVFNGKDSISLCQSLLNPNKLNILSFYKTFFPQPLKYMASSFIFVLTFTRPTYQSINILKP